jgi:hypothetical protein
LYGLPALLIGFMVGYVIKFDRFGTATWVGAVLVLLAVSQWAGYMKGSPLDPCQPI